MAQIDHYGCDGCGVDVTETEKKRVGGYCIYSKPQYEEVYIHDHWKCAQCNEKKINFDLCEDCYDDKDGKGYKAHLEAHKDHIVFRAEHSKGDKAT